MNDDGSWKSGAWGSIFGKGGVSTRHGDCRYGTCFGSLRGIEIPHPAGRLSEASDWASVDGMAWRGRDCSCTYWILRKHIVYLLLGADDVLESG